MFEKFTDRARKVLQLAEQEAVRFQHEFVGTEHLLLGLLAEGSGVAANVLKNLDVDLRKVRQEVERIIQPGQFGDQLIASRLPHTPRAKKVLELAVTEATVLNFSYVGTEHLLLGMIHESEGVAAQVLLNVGLTLEEVRAEVLALLGHDPKAPASRLPVSPAPSSPSPRTKSKTPALDAFCRDLVAEANAHRLYPPPGHEAEADQLLQLLLLSRGNPLLIGDPDDAKIVIERAANRTANWATYLPNGFGNLRLLEPQVPALDPLRGGKLFPERATALLNELSRSQGSWLIVQTLHPFGPASVSRDINDSLRAAVIAGRIRVIWSVTPTEHAALAADTDLAAHLIPITLSELPPDVVFERLKLARDLLQEFHRLHITNNAVRVAVELGGKFNAAFDLLDRTAAAVRFRLAGEPPSELKQLADEQDRLDAEKEAAIANELFVEAAALRDREERLRAQRATILAEWRQRATPHPTVTAEDVRGVATGQQDASSADEAVVR